MVIWRHGPKGGPKVVRCPVRVWRGAACSSRTTMYVFLLAKVDQKPGGVSGGGGLGRSRVEFVGSRFLFEFDLGSLVARSRWIGVGRDPFCRVCVRAQARKRSKKEAGLGIARGPVCPALDVPLHMGEGVDEAVDGEEMGLAVLRQNCSNFPRGENKKNRRVKTLFLLALCHCSICSAT